MNDDECVKALREAGFLVLPPGEHLLLDNPYGDDQCALCGHDVQDLPEKCDRVYEW